MKKFKYLIMSCVLGISLLVSTNVFAKADAIVCKDAQENYYQYDLNSLSHDAVKSALNLPSALFDEYMQKPIVSFHDNKTGYVDKDFINKTATMAAMDGGPCGAFFTLDKCTELADRYENAILTFTKPIQTRIFDSNGKVVNGAVINPNGTVVNLSNEAAAVSLNKTTDTMRVGVKEALTGTIYSSNVTNQDATWTSSNPNVATVNNGVITAVSAGTTIITITIADGNKTASCTITVYNYKDFKDENLEKVIRDEIDKPTGDILNSDIEKVTKLDAGRRGIKDITGIEKLINLKELNLNNNQISDVSALNGLTNLKELNLAYNQISDISGLKGLSDLQRLYLYENKISNISVLNGLTNLKELNLTYNQISDISALNGLTNLQELYLNNNKISNISGLNGLSNLKELSLNNNEISDISVFKGLINLQTLSLGGNQISDISALKGLTNLEYLTISNNKISDNDKILLRSALHDCRIYY